MSDYDGVQVSGQRDAGKCSAVQQATVTYILYKKLYYVYYHLCVFMKSKGNPIMWSKFKC